jgi:hypothetical protein
MWLVGFKPRPLYPATYWKRGWVNTSDALHASAGIELGFLDSLVTIPTELSRLGIVVVHLSLCLIKPSVMKVYGEWRYSSIILDHGTSTHRPPSMYEAWKLCCTGKSLVAAGNRNLAVWIPLYRLSYPGSMLWCCRAKNMLDVKFYQRILQALRVP